MTTKEAKPLELKVLGFVQERCLIPAKQKLVVAVSGGPDSVCLLHVLAQLRERLGIELQVAHLDHQLRGAEAEADARYVADLARRLGIGATIEQRDVRAYQKQERLSLEEAAREVRYSFLARVAKSSGASHIAVGHTRDDHIETILMHLIRGTGTRGLRGLEPATERKLEKSTFTIIRPLFEVSRKETQGYCRQHHLRPRTDASNRSLSPLRNRIRHRLLPVLEDYNPQIAQALLRTAQIATDDLAYLDKEVSRLWAKVARKRGSTIILDRGKLLGLPLSLKRNLLRAAIEKLTGTLKDIEVRHIEEIIAALDKPAGKRLDLPSGLIFSVGYSDYLLGRDPAALCPFPTLDTELPLNVPGSTGLPGWQMVAQIITREQQTADNDLTAYFDLAKTGNNLTARCRRRGDRFQPLGMSLSKKLGEFMIDSKIPAAWRERIPIVCSEKHILWVVGSRIDDRVKVTTETKQVLRLEFVRG